MSSSMRTDSNSGLRRSLARAVLIASSSVSSISSNWLRATRRQAALRILPELKDSRRPWTTALADDILSFKPGVLLCVYVCMYVVQTNGYVPSCVKLFRSKTRRLTGIQMYVFGLTDWWLSDWLLISVAWFEIRWSRSLEQPRNTKDDLTHLSTCQVSKSKRSSYVAITSGLHRATKCSIYINKFLRFLWPWKSVGGNCN